MRTLCIVAISFLNISLPCENNCVIFSHSPISSLDIKNNIYYSIVQSIVGATWILTIDFNQKTEAQVSRRSQNLLGLQTLVYNPEDKLLYGYLTWETETYFYNTSIITLDPITAEYKVVTMIDLPENMPVTQPMTFSPLLVNLNLQRKLAYALYTTLNTTSKCYYHNLKTIDILTGKVTYSVSLDQTEWCPPDPEPPEPYGLTTMVNL